MMNLNNLPIFEIIAFLGIVTGPVLAYWFARRKSKAEILLIDINTIKGWSEQRRNSEKERAELRQALSDEQNLRRSDREKYLKKIDEIQKELSVLRDKLRECGDDLTGERYGPKFPK